MNLSNYLYSHIRFSFDSKQKKKRHQNLPTYCVSTSLNIKALDFSFFSGFKDSDVVHYLWNKEININLLKYIIVLKDIKLEITF